jgi:hypothetical protein
MLQGHVSDKHEGSEFYEIKATGWNINALVALMSVVHGHSEFLCSDITLATLTDVAIIADHYSLSTAVSESTTLDLWLTQHSNSDRLFIGDDLNIEASLKRLAIACTFAKNRQQQELQLQQHLIGLLVRYTPRPLKGAGLPITATYISKFTHSIHHIT